MPDADPPSEEQLLELEQRLVELRDRLQEELDAPSDSVATVDLDQPIGRVSRVDAIQQQKMAQEARRRTRGRLGQVRQALAAMREGEYGECRRCGDTIELRRLQARPETPFCVTCQDAAERRR